MVIKNFLFHRVSDDTDAMWPPMKPALFSEIISYLTKKYAIIPLEHYLNSPGDFSTTKRIATILFDDGYKDNIEIAAPILRQYNCPASFYIVTDCINRNIPTWTYIVDHIFQYTTKQKIELVFDFVPEQFRLIQLKKDQHESRIVKNVKPWLKKLSNTRRIKIVQAILDQCNDVPLPYNKMMNWNDIRQLATEGFIIGSHSHTHPMLASLNDEKEISDELRVSSQIIFNETGKTPQTISYPIGSFDDRVLSLAKQEGYKYGLAVEQRFFYSGRDDFFKIPRVELYQEAHWKLQLRISGIYSRLKKTWV
jgi:peptidoglycan/xylan/chitin deacetylase (PgdA/CDA1 family)